MKKFISMIVRSWSGSPGKIVLTLASVALGSGILILSDSAGRILEEKIKGELEKGGVILYAANGEWDSDGRIDQVRPSEWDSLAPGILVDESQQVESAVPVSAPPFSQISTNGKSYNLRSAVGTGPAYFSVFSLDIVAGVPMGEDDISLGSRKVWISSAMAEQLYGSSDQAVGQWIQPPGDVLKRGPGGRNRNMVIQYSVAGVFQSPSEIARRSYGIGDLIFPYTSLISAGGNIQMMKDMMAGQLVLKASDSSVEKVKAQIAETLSRNYGDDISLVVWEGSPAGESDYMNQLRGTVRIFSVALSILGMLLLFTSSLGIFSIMVVEALNRRRTIGLERALGASRFMVVREFWSWSMTLSLAGAFAGVLFAVILARPVLDNLSPLLGEISGSLVTEGGLKFSSVMISLSLAVLFGGILGVLPSFSAVRGGIADTLREE